MAELFDDIRPIQRRQLHETCDNIAHGYVGGALSLQLITHNLIGADTSGAKQFFQMLKGGRNRWITVPQALHQLDRESFRKSPFAVGSENPLHRFCGVRR